MTSRTFPQLAIFIIFALAVSACTAGPTSSTSAALANPLPAQPAAAVTLHPPFTVVRQAGIFTLYSLDADQEALADVAEALLAYAPQVSRSLDYDYRFAVIVELFPDQVSLDRLGMNPDQQGFYAYSGSRRIQMVSPRQPAAGVDLAYTDRVLIAVHEFAHLVENEINPDLPVWLEEGAAIYAGPHQVYDEVWDNRFPFENTPSFQDLVQSYASLPAADLLAYSAVDYIVHRFGPTVLNRLLRSPGELEAVLGVSRAEFERGWREFINDR